MPGRLEELAEFEEMLVEPTAEDKAASSASTVPAGDAAAAQAAQKKPGGIHHPLEKPVKRKLSRGHLALEARIDLHGLIQSEAHGILLDFLLRAHDRGLRHVLVITGKGRVGHGVLKQRTPEWLAGPALREMIAGVSTADQRHGGDGALYVALKRKG